MKRVVLGLYGFDAIALSLLFVLIWYGPITSPAPINIFHASLTTGSTLLALILLAPGSKRLNRAGRGVLLVVVGWMALTAFDMMVIDRYGDAWRKWMTVHIVVGIGMAAPFILVFLMTHLWKNRAEGWTSSAGRMGHLTYFLARFPFWCGMIAGFAIGPAWMFDVHRWGMGLGLVLVVWHIVRAGKSPLGRVWTTRAFLIPASVSLVIYGGTRVWLAQESTVNRLSQNEFIANARLEPVGKADRLAPSRVVSESGHLYDASLLGNSRRSCGEFGCHEPILKQWEESPHRLSANVFYREVVRDLMVSRGPETARLCASCHDPIALLSGALNDPGKAYPTDSDGEGISCIVCHSIRPGEGAVENGNYTFRFPSGFFTNIQNIYTAHDLKDEHSAAFLPEAMKSAEYCGMCHRVVVPRDLAHAGVDMVEQDPYTSWREGPFNRTDHPGFVALRDCVSCHMARDTRERGGRIEGNHRFAASNSAYPHRMGHAEQAEAVRVFLTSDVVDLEWSRVDRRDERWIDGSVAVRNKGVGHVFPAGPLEVNDVWVEIRARNGDGSPIPVSVASDEEPRKVGRYVMGSFDGPRRIERFLDLFEVSAPPVKRTVAPGGEVKIPVRIHVGEASGAAGRDGVIVEARLFYRKFNRVFTEEVLGSGVELPVVEMASAVWQEGGGR